MNTKKGLFSLIAIAFFTVAQADQVSVEQKESKISVSGTSTVHDWEMSTSLIDGSTQFIRSDDGRVEIAGTKISLKASDLSSGNSGLDKKAYEALKSEKYSTITFVQTAKVAVIENNGEFTATLSGNLTIAGKPKPPTVTIKGSSAHNRLKVSGKVPLKMTDFDMEPPRAMMGAIKSGNEVTVNFDTVLK